MRRVGNGSVLAMGLVLCLGLAAFGGLAESANCPIATNSSVCAEVTEPVGVTNLKETVITIERDGVALPNIVIPASSVTGGAVQSATVSSVACAVDTYTAKAFSNYNTSMGVMASLVVSSTPTGGIVKDRSAEAACMKVPTNFTIR